MKPCIFCKIVRGQLPALKLYEDTDFIAILDINPNTPGMCLVLPKKHYPSYAFDLPDAVLKRLIIASKKVSKILEQKLKCKRVGLIMEGIGVDHTHMKLYPMHGLSRKYVSIIHPKRVFFRKYPGYLTSLLGPKISKKKLEKIHRKLTK